MGCGTGRAAIVAGLLLLPAAAIAGPVDWRRGNDWVPGAIPGSTVNNPGPATGGLGVWKYERIEGGGALGTEDPWYLRDRELLKWDDQWWETGTGAWSGGDNVSPPVMQDRFIHNLHSSTFQYTPVVSWINPLGNGTEVAVSGSLTLRWSGAGGMGFPVDVDVVVAFHDASSGIITPLLASTYSKPIAGPSINDQVVIPLNLAGPVTFDANDALIISHRGRNSFAPMGMWVTVFDNVTMTQVPTPGSIALLALAGVTLGLRRRR